MKVFAPLIISLGLMASLASADPKAVHGMLLFGNQQTYASHLPMFHPPHDYQVLLQLQLTDVKVPAGVQPTLKKYESAKSKGATYFTLVPEPLDLSLVINGTKTSFKAKIVEGHFERGGTTLGPVNVAVAKNILSKKLDPATPPSGNNEYLVFGSAGEYYAAHLIEGAPGYDAIAQVSQPEFFKQLPCTRVNCPDPLEVPINDQQLPVTLNALFDLPQDFASIGNIFAGAFTNILHVLHLEENELAH